MTTASPFYNGINSSKPTLESMMKRSLQEHSVQRWKTQILEFSSSIFLIVGMTSIAILLSQKSIGSRINSFHMVPTFSLLCIAYGWRSGPLHLRGLCLIFAAWYGMAAAILIRGYSIPNPFVAGIFVCVFAALMLERKHTWMVIVGTIILTVVLSFPWIAGKPPLQDKLVISSLWLNWLRILIIFAFFSIASALGIMYLVSKLESTLQSSEVMIEELESSRLELSQAKQKAEVSKESAIAANHAKSFFLASMSHEIRTPLTTIIGITDLLDESSFSAEQKRKLELISLSSQALLSTVDELLDLSEIESRKIHIAPEAMNLLKMGENVQDLIGTAAEHNNVEISYSHDGQEYVLADSRRIRQIMLNLVSFVVRSTNDRVVSLATSCRSIDRKNKVEFSILVGKNSISSSRQKQSHLFSPEASEGLSEKAGFELNVVQNLTSILGGEFVIKEWPSGQTSFRVTFETTSVSPPEETPTKSIVRHHETEKMSVLLAEDNIINQEVFQAMLTNLGCQVTIVDNGQKAVEAIKEEQGSFNLILMDCQMPVLNGLDATRQIRENGFSHFIVALTAHATPEIRQSCLEAGMNDFATKPITINHLREIVEKASRIA